MNDIDSGTVIETHGIERTYQQGKLEVHALRGVDFELKKGEFTALAGPSGSGKTTLLNLIGCLDKATAGSLSVNGNAVDNFSKTAPSRKAC